ncbi:MAG: SMP-30/gluconolactonase/LRE family protein [Hyphomonadaceae bacterium]|nr:SMP-30/gluconolactonase/LRE family protein [Hyphomonadaceae bacterium]
MIRSLGVSVLALTLVACGETSKTVTYEVTEFIGPSPFHGLHGLAVEPDGTVLAGSVVGQAIYAVNPATGEVTTRLGPPDGMADDIAFGPDGVMAWTGYLTGKVFVQEKGGAPRMVSSGLPGSNSLAFTKDGKLYLTQVFLGDALYEVDWKGTTGARLIRKDLGGLNGFEIGPDGMIYGPLWFKHAIVRVDPATGADTVVADGFEIPAAANFGPDGKLYAIDTKTGELKRIDLVSKKVDVVTTLAPALDNLAFGPNGKVYVSNMAEATIYEIDPATGDTKKIVSGPLATPTDLAITDGPEGERLHVADVFAYRVIDTATGAITDPLRMYRDETENQLGVGAGKSKVLITSWAAGMVQVVDRATQKSVSISHGLAAPVDALELADGRIIALEAAKGVISQIDPATPSTAENPPAALVTGLNMPVSMAEAADGKIYVTESATGSLSSVDLATGEIVRLKDGLASPEGVDIGADGRVYVAEAGAGRLIAYDPKDKSIVTIVEGLKTGLPAAEGTLPAFTTTGVAVSKKDGAIYVSSDITNAIYKVTARK